MTDKHKKQSKVEENAPTAPAAAPAGVPDAAVQSPSTPAAPAAPQIPPPKDEKDVLREQVLRLRADFENLRKRTERERTEMRQRLIGDLADAILPALDDLDLAVKVVRSQAKDAALAEGLDVGVQGMRAALGKMGVEPIVCVGKPFDPALHEAVLEIDAADVPAGAVVSELRRGYRIGSRVIRPARVAVAREVKPAETVPGLEQAPPNPCAC
jgi:molecular chaperone GrpE